MCKFCDAMQRNRQIDDALKTHNPDVAHRYSVALVSRVFVKGLDGCRGCGTDYRHEGRGYKLNYCPECGTAIMK